MNKRQRKKQEDFRRNMKNDTIYLKLYLNEDEKYDQYNPVIKCKGFAKFFSTAMRLATKYKCNFGYYNPDSEKRIDNYFKNKYDGYDE